MIDTERKNTPYENKYDCNGLDQNFSTTIKVKKQE